MNPNALVGRPTTAHSVVRGLCSSLVRLIVCTQHEWAEQFAIDAPVLWIVNKEEYFVRIFNVATGNVYCLCYTIPEDVLRAVGKKQAGGISGA